MAASRAEGGWPFLHGTTGGGEGGDRGHEEHDMLRHCVQAHGDLSAGGLVEKSVIPQSLATNLAMAVIYLRRWMRWRLRAVELGVTIPDASVMARALHKMVSRVVEKNPELTFKMALARNTLQLDTVPSQEAVLRYAEHLLSEVEAVAHLEKKTSATVKQTWTSEVKAKKVETQETGESKNKADEPRPCRFFLTEKGCRKGRACKWSHDQKDQRMRCWSCGASEAEKPKLAKTNAEGTKTENVEQGSLEATPRTGTSSSSAGAGSPDAASVTPEGDGNVMKEALLEATKMIKSLNVQAPAESHKMESEQTLRSLQRQLDSMRETMRMRQITLKLSKVELSSTRGLVDSGATNPLRPMQDGEDVTAYEDRVVELAAGESYTLRVTPGGTLVAASGTQPIVPMGALVQSLGCRLSWTGGHCKIRHPCRGDLPVAMNQGCPELPMHTALELIKELEEKQMAKLKSLSVNEDLEYVKKVVDEHPAFKDVPWHVKKELLVQPAENWKALGLNRSWRRRLERNGGAAIHLFAGPREGHDLSRAYRELEGHPRV